MSFLLPPYSRYHIAVLGAVTLLAYLSVLLFFIPTPTTHSGTAISSSALKSKFGEAVAEAQSGMYAKAWIERRFVILDIRPKADYDESHIIGAQSSPVDFLAASSPTVDFDIVLYSSNHSDLATAAGILREKGATKIFLLSDSLVDLKKQGYKLSSEVDQ